MGNSFKEDEWVELLIQARKAGIPIGDIRLFLTNKLLLKQHIEKEEKTLNSDNEKDIDERMVKLIMLKRYNAILNYEKFNF